MADRNLEEKPTSMLHERLQKQCISFETSWLHVAPMTRLWFSITSFQKDIEIIRLPMELNNQLLKKKERPGVTYIQIG